jgi:magnesium transporter
LFVYWLLKEIIIPFTESKKLDILSVIVFPLTLLAAIFGMNTKYMPLTTGRHDFWIIIALMGIGSLVMLFIFEKKNWLK